MDRKVAIITGASSGIGAGLCRDLVARGWIVAMADIHQNEELSAELGDNARFYWTNVANYASQARTFQAVFADFGRLDALCANAGIVDRGSLYILDRKHAAVNDIPAEPDMSCTDVNYKGVVYGTQLAVHFMRNNKTPGGAIVATCSIAAVHPHPTYPEYNGTKAAVLNFVRGVCEVLYIKENIRINTVLPGIVSTDIVPRRMIEAVSAECLTPVRNVTQAIAAMAEASSMAGEAVECSANEQLKLPWNSFQNGDVTKRAVTVWEPLFSALHHENSDLPDAIL